MENLMDGYPVVIEAPVACGEMDWRVMDLASG